MAENLVSENQPAQAAPEGAASVQNVQNEHIEHSAGWEIITTIKQWKMKEKREFMRLMNSATAGEDEAASYPFLAKIVTRWPYKLNPADPASYDELTVEQFDEVLSQIKAAFQ